MQTTHSTASDAETAASSTTRRPRPFVVSESSRSLVRKQRQVEIEKEQKIEEAEALKQLMDQSHHLARPLAGVKTEFSDLDGVKWTGSMLRRRTQCPNPTIKVTVPTRSEYARATQVQRHTASEESPSPTLSDFSVVEPTPLASTFSERDLQSSHPSSHDDTIRLTDTRRRYLTSLPSSYHAPRSPTFPEIQNVPTHTPRFTHPKKGYPLEDEDEDATICIPIHPPPAADYSKSPVTDHSNSLTIRASNYPLHPKSSPKNENIGAIVGRVFCREYEYGPDGQRKQGRWHAVEGLRVELP
ncbi:hypothetical protein ONZ45_g16997 [Pleurotus djamor]|nr:hypothetical protein ONZ45_g16997 [Pleurotus djamor]